SPPGRGWNTVLHYGRRRVADNRHRHRERPRHAQAGARGRRTAERLSLNEAYDVSALTLQRLRAEGQAFMEAISRESYLAFAGLKKTAELQPIYKQYERILGEEALELTLGAFRDARDGSDDKR